MGSAWVQITLSSCPPTSHLPTNDQFTYLPTCLPTDLPTYRPTYRPTYPPRCVKVQHIYLRWAPEHGFWMPTAARGRAVTFRAGSRSGTATAGAPTCRAAWRVPCAPTPAPGRWKALQTRRTVATQGPSAMAAACAATSRSQRPTWS
eukprot:364902-Chlamydomonas_euryale.AAC.27